MPATGAWDEGRWGLGGWGVGQIDVSVTLTGVVASGEVGTALVAIGQTILAVGVEGASRESDSSGCTGCISAG